MKVLKIFKKKSKFLYLFIFIMGALNSLVYSGILIVINHVITDNPLPYYSEYAQLIFFSLVGVSLLSSKLFQTHLVKLTHEFLLDFELSILNKLRFASLPAFERLGSEKVYTAISDTRILSQVPEYFLGALNAFIIVVCGLVYVFAISPVGGLGMLFMMLLLLIVYLIRNAAIEKDLNILRNLQNRYHLYLHDLLHGFRELKMSLIRNESIYHHYLEVNRISSQELGVKTSLKYVNNELIGSYSWYLILGTIMFGLPAMLQIQVDEIAAFIITVLFLMGPVATLILFIPFYTRVKIALERIHELEYEVSTGINQEKNTLDVSDIDMDIPFDNLRFEQVTFEYPGAKNDFRLDPIDIEIKKGEVVFITGGNGSGKSTFINLLTGLQKPKSGKILLNNKEIRSFDYDSYRNCFAAIFTDPYLFSQNYDKFDLSQENPHFIDILSRMRLQDKVRIDDEDEMIDLGLSKGQKKRLAMVYSILEQKDIIVLDEWAAEQDPHFRKYFYECFLEYLRNSGKTVIAVTHDDRYFEQADRILRFDYGAITELGELHKMDNPIDMR